MRVLAQFGLSDQHLVVLVVDTLAARYVSDYFLNLHLLAES